MIRIRISSDALLDLEVGYEFYERQETGLGEYFATHIRADIEGLKISAGIHRKLYRDLHRLMSKKFPFAIFYRLDEEIATVVAIVDCRKDPDWIDLHLDHGDE